VETYLGEVSPSPAKDVNPRDGVATVTVLFLGTEGSVGKGRALDASLIPTLQNLPA